MSDTRKPVKAEKSYIVRGGDGFNIIQYGKKFQVSDPVQGRSFICTTFQAALNFVEKRRMEIRTAPEEQYRAKRREQYMAKAQYERSPSWLGGAATSAAVDFSGIMWGPPRAKSAPKPVPKSAPSVLEGARKPRKLLY
jgi:hypothetical protein